MHANHGNVGNKRKAATSHVQDRCRRRWLLGIAIFCMFPMACVQGKRTSVSSATAVAQPIANNKEDVMERLKHSVDRLISTEFSDIAAVNAQLQSHLGPLQQKDGFQIRISDSGELAGIPVNDIELRSATDDASHATLLLRFPAPGVSVDDIPWPNAVLYPPRPDAPDSLAYWSIDAANDAQVILGLSPDQTRLIQVTIRKH